MPAVQRSTIHHLLYRDMILLRPSVTRNSKTVSMFLVRRAQGVMQHPHIPPPPAYKISLTTQRDTPSSLPGIASSLPLSTLQQHNTENASLGQTTSGYGSSPYLPLPSTMGRCSPTENRDILSYDHKAFCELVKTARERANISQKRLASILCISYGAKFAKSEHSIQRFRSRLFADDKMKSLYPIFKAWLDAVARNASAPRDKSTTKLRSGRACKPFSKDQYAVLMNEFDHDHWPSTQRLAELAKHFAVGTKNIRQWFAHQRAKKSIRKAPRTQPGSECSSSKLQDSQDQRVEHLDGDEEDTSEESESEWQIPGRKISLRSWKFVIQ